MSDDVYGHAFVEIRPDTSKFARLLQRELPRAVRSSNMRRELQAALQSQLDRCRLQVSVTAKASCAQIKEQFRRCTPDIAVRVRLAPRACAQIQSQVSDCRTRLSVIPYLVSRYCERIQSQFDRCIVRIHAEAETSSTLCDSLRARVSNCKLPVNVTPKLITGYCALLQQQLDRCDLTVRVAPDFDIDALRRSLRTVTQQIDKDSSDIRDRLREIGITVVRTLGRATSVLTAFAAAVGAIAPLMLHTVSATVGLVGAVSPLAALLPSVALGFGLLRGTLLLAGPAILKAFSPLTSLFSEGEVKGGVLTGVGAVRQRIGELASRGLPELAQAFVRVNMPAISRGMERIAVATNLVVLRFGAWVNSVQGQQTIAMLVNATASAVEHLLPKVTLLAIAFGEMIRRLGPGAILGFGLALERAAMAAVRLINSITREDIDRGLVTVRDAADAVFGRLTAVWHVIQFIGNNEGRIRAVSDALAGIGIALGAVTGYWPAVVIGAVTLILNHFNQIVTTGKRIWQDLSRDPTVRTYINGIRVLWQNFITGFMIAMSYVSRVIIPIFKSSLDDIRAAIETLRRSGVNWNLVFRVVGATLAGLAGIILGVVVVALKVLTMQIRAATLAVGPLWQAFRFMTRVFLDAVGTMIAGAARAFGWIPGIGPKLRAAEQQFDIFRKRVNAQLNGIQRGVDVRVRSLYDRPAHGNRPFAAGGRVRGPGTGTSDSIPALLSNGEYVINAKATRSNLALLQAINSNRYALGGLVGRYADGGQVTTITASYRDLATAPLLRAVTEYLRSIVFSSPGLGTGVERWRAVALAALRYTRSPESWIGSLLRRMNRESGGNPRAINNWDSNAQRGDPSRGLMQTIGSTFRAYARELVYRGIYDPFANIVASIRYANAAYGSAPRGWDRSGGYDNGGWLMPGVTMAYNRTGRPERVLSPDETQTVNNYYLSFPNYVGSRDDLVRAINDLKRQRRI